MLKSVRLRILGRLAILVAFLPVAALQIPAQEKGSSTTSPARILEQMDTLKARVESIRGLKYRSDFKKGLQSPQAFQAYLSKEIDQEYSAKRLYAWKRWLVQFGFVSESLDIRKMMLDLLQEQVVGYYDPERKHLYLIDKDLSTLLGGAGKVSKEEEAALTMMKNMGVDLSGMLISHELDHALQDQYFDLTKMKKQREKNEDRSAAVSSIIEGESTLVMIEFLFKGFGLDPGMFGQFGDMLDGLSSTAAPGMGKLGEAPEYFRENLMFPYVQGAKLALALRKGGSWDLLNEAMRHPPESTEQVLHPEKYWPKRDNPVMISMGDVQGTLGSDWERLEENSLGELNISILGRKYLSKEKGARMGSGWGGDSFQIFENKKARKTALAWFTTWDSVDDARNFFDGYYHLLLKKYPNAYEGTGEGVGRDADRGAWASVRRLKIPGTEADITMESSGSDVIILEGLSDPLKSAALRKMRDSKKRVLDAPPLPAKLGNR